MATAIQSSGDHTLDFAASLLGGKAVLHNPVNSQMDAVRLVQEGVPAGALKALVDKVNAMQSPDFMEKALGISLRTYQRRKNDNAKSRLNLDQSGRIWRFAEILAKCTDLLGSLAEAERWLNSPALGLDGMRPIDLINAPNGANLVEEYLNRLEYGVYT